MHMVSVFAVLIERPIFFAKLLADNSDFRFCGVSLNIPISSAY